MRNNGHLWKTRAHYLRSAVITLAALTLLLLVLIGCTAYEFKVATDENINLVRQYASLIQEYTDLKNQEPQIQVVEKVVMTESVTQAEYIGDYTITYYCSCEKCCGAYGSNRPVVNNKEVVFTSTGAFAQEGITVAVDPSKIPYGTVLYIEGVGIRIAQDCGGAIKGNKIDVYVSDHDEALQHGKHQAKVYTINMKEEQS